jgi:integrase
MASISTAPGGSRTLQFVAKDGRRKSIRLGKVSLREAEEIKRRVERLAAAQAANLSLDNETAQWLAGIGNDLAAKLAAAGLVAGRQAAHSRLGPFIDAYIAQRSDAKPQTLFNLRMFGDRLKAFFGADKLLAEIKRSDADAWLVYLKSKEYAAATIGRTVKGARQLFKAACRAEIIARNPFDDLKAGSNPDKDRQRFITQEDTQRVLDACPDAEWRLLVALSRYGGLRCPSEHLALTWADVDWERQRFRVDSPKTGERWVPIFPELRPYLEDVFEQAAEGAVQVITCKQEAKQNLRTRLCKIIRRAGLTPWPKPFHNLRASRQTELAAVYPLHVVCTWIGNSTLIAQKHYLQTTEEDFRRAAQSGAAALQKAVQQPAASLRTDSQEAAEEEADCELVRNDASPCEASQYARRDSNPQPAAPKAAALSS